MTKAILLMFTDTDLISQIIATTEKAPCQTVKMQTMATRYRSLTIFVKAKEM